MDSTESATNALILTPRKSAFKWMAERAEYVCYKDCPQDAAGIEMESTTLVAASLDAEQFHGWRL